MTPDLIKDLISQTFNDPRAAARRILDLQLPRNVVVLIFALTCVVSAIIGYLVSIATVGTANQIFSPIGGVVYVAAGVVVSSMLISSIGRMLGGTGRFYDLFILILWSQIIQIGFSVVSIIANIFSQGLSYVVDYASIGFSIWLLVNFTTVVHGFKSRPLVAMGIFGIVFVLAFVVSIVLTSTGIIAVPAGA